MAFHARLLRTAFFGVGLFTFTFAAERWRGNTWQGALKQAFINAFAVLSVGFPIAFWLAVS